MTPRVRPLYSFPIDLELASALKRVKAARGVSEAEQIRRGIALWLQSIGEAATGGPAARRALAPRRQKQLAALRLWAAATDLPGAELALVVPLELGAAMGGGRALRDLTTAQRARLADFTRQLAEDFVRLALGPQQED
jgi:hypothetical protein